MASLAVREITTTTGGNGTGIPFHAACIAMFLKNILGFTNYYENAGTGSGFTGSTASGTAGSFSGTSKDFTDAGASFIGSEVGNYIVIKDTANNRNCGIFKITARPSGTTLTLDWRSATTEYPAVSTGMSWWIMGPASAASTGSIVSPNGDLIDYGQWIVIDDGFGINRQIAIRFYNSYYWVGGYPSGDTRNYVGVAYSGANSWMGGIIAGNKVSRWDYISGKTLIINGVSVTFTGTNPLEISSIISQINSAHATAYPTWPAPVVYESDSLGYARTGGGYLTFRVDTGKPQYPSTTFTEGGPNQGGAANNTITLTYAGSDAWAELGLTGTSNLATAALGTQYNHAYDNRNFGLTPTPAATIALDMKNNITSAARSISATNASATVNLTNTIAGSHGNKLLVQNSSPPSAVFTLTGMQNGVGQQQGDYFRCRTPHALGWEIEVVLWAHSTAPYLDISISTNQEWGATGKVIGPVYIGSVAAGVNWLYLEGDSDGKWINIFEHQTTNSRYNGVIVANLNMFDSGHDDTEKVILCGNTNPSSTYYDGGSLSRTYDSYHVGHGYVWDFIRGIQKDAWMVEPTYGGYANGLSKWTSRERNRRRSGTPVPTTGNSLTFSGGMVTLAKSASGFTAADTGKKIRISGCTNAGNNGVFTVTYVSSTQVSFPNASGVTETSGFSWSMDYQDLINGTIVLCDPDNYNGMYEMLGRMLGHYSCRVGAISGWNVRKGFDESGYLDKFHINDGIAIEWPNVTPQH